MSSCTTRHHSTLTGLEFNVVHKGSQRYFSQRKGIPDLRIDPAAAEQLLAYPQPIGRQNVPLLTVFIHQKSNVGGPVWIVLNRIDNRRYPILVPLEINDTVFPLMSPTYIPHCHAALVIATTSLPQGLQQ